MKNKTANTVIIFRITATKTVLRDVLILFIAKSNPRVPKRISIEAV
jgi:hypothetical protein